MRSTALHDLASVAGVATEWTDASCGVHEVAADSLRLVLKALDLPTDSGAAAADPDLPPLVIVDAGAPIHLVGREAATGSYKIDMEGGALVEGLAVPVGDGSWELPGIADIGYHRLSFDGRETTLAVAPPRCFTIHDADAGGAQKFWGLAAPVYALRRKGDGGIGDFGGLSEFVSAAAARGADAFAINPVHAPFAALPERFSPYAPSSRALLNPLHADPRAALGAAFVARAAAGFAVEFENLEALPLIDWQAAARAKMHFLRELFDSFDASDAATKRDCAAFRKAGGQALEDHARFEAIQAALLPADPLNGNWRNWPLPMQNPRGRAVAEFASENDGEVSFHVFLQWLADRSLVSAQKTARDAGMKIGLVADLAVGATADGSYAWSRQSEMLSSLSIGAPPDLFNMQGQSWGIAPFSPRALKGGGYKAFLEALRATMKHAGGIRVDHAMGLARLWVVPEGLPPTEGTYLRYPMRDMFRLIALESWRNRAIVIGEDLGTVEEGFRDLLHATGILGTQVMWFERDRSGFFSPHIYSPDAMATTTTHDLPTVAGWWQGSDIADRERAGLLAPGEVAREIETRAEDRAALWRTFNACGASDRECPAWTESDAAVDAAVAYIARTPSSLVMLPLDDVLALPEQANMPGTVDEFPNWRRRLPGTADEIFDAPDLRARLATIAEIRPRKTL